MQTEKAHTSMRTRKRNLRYFLAHRSPTQDTDPTSFLLRLIYKKKKKNKNKKKKKKKNKKNYTNKHDYAVFQ